MRSLINIIDSKENPWDKGMSLGVVLAIIAVIAKSSINLSLLHFQFNYQNDLDWLLILFLGLSIFFFFMGIRLNTEINTNINIQNLIEGKQNKNTFTSFQTHLDKFNILSKISFIISIIFGLIFITKLLAIGVNSLIV